MKFEHLLGRSHVEGETDCYDIVRCIFRDNHGIELTNYARPHGWWTVGMDLFTDNFAKEGFRIVDVPPYKAEPYDVFLITVHSPVPNLAGVVLEDGRILHHAPGRFSEATPMNGIWRNRLSMIVRHKDVRNTHPLPKLNILDVLHPIKRKFFENARHSA